MRSTTATAGAWSIPGSTPRAIRAAWAGLLAGPLGGRPVRRVIVTHHHPDHVGLAGWFQARGRRALGDAHRLADGADADARRAGPPHARDAGLLARRRAWTPELLARAGGRAALQLRRRGGADAARLPPDRAGRGDRGRRAALAGRDRPRPRAGAGDALGDRPRPGAGGRPDPAGDHAEPRGLRHRARRRPGGRLARLLPPAAGAGRERHLALPGHRRPFRGLPARLAELAAHQEEALDRLRGFLAAPRRASGRASTCSTAGRSGRANTGWRWPRRSGTSTACVHAGEAARRRAPMARGSGAVRRNGA